MKASLAVILVVASFLAGCAFTQYRMETVLLPTLNRFSTLNWGLLFSRIVDDIDSGDVAMARKRAFALAMVQLDPLPPTPVRWQFVLVPDAHASEGALSVYLQSIERVEPELREKLERQHQQRQNDGA